TIPIAVCMRARAPTSRCRTAAARRRGSISTTRRSARRRGFLRGIISSMSKCGDEVLKVRRVLALMVLATLMSPAPLLRAQAPSAGPTDPRIVKLLGSISEERMQQLLQTLVSFETRNTLSDPTSATRGIGAARQWIYDELKRTSPKLQVSF